MSRIVGFGAERIELPFHAGREAVDERRRVMLARCLNLQTTVAFLGSGCSAPLGYPRWLDFTRGVVATTATALGECSDFVHQELRSRLERIAARLARAPAPSTPDMLFHLGLCQRIGNDLAREHGAPNPYDDYLRVTFGRPDTVERPVDPENNPHHALLELPIKRFVTTNYDVELELALSTRHAGLRPRSFTQRSEHYDELAAFALAHIPGTENMVFHCHGRYDDLPTIVATEADYQRWYVDESDPAAETFRQSLRLLFGSNPIFFIGFGMEDYDLLAPLRLLNTDRTQQRTRARQLFALMPEAEGDDEARDRSDQLYERYGVHVIPYRKPDGGASEWGRALCRALKQIRNEWCDARDEFLAKPVIRKVSVPARPREPYLHYALDRGDAADIAPERTKEDLRELQKLIAEPGIVVVYGSGGSGKSWRVLELLDRVQQNRGSFQFHGVFFWSSYYADDWLTGLDRVLTYLDSPIRPRSTRLQRFEDSLKERHLIVFDGFERLLREKGAVEAGTPYSRAVERILEMARDGESTVVLTTRLQPDVLEEGKRVRLFPMRRLTTEDLEKGQPFASLQRQGLTVDDVSALCSLCEGHSYALALAAAHIGAAGPAHVVDRMTRLRRELSLVSPARRIAQVIRMAIEDVRARTSPKTTELLERLSIFMSPATDATIEICWGDEPHLDDALDALRTARLIFPVQAHPAGGTEPGYTVHPTVRTYMFHQDRWEESDSLPNFTLAGFTSGNAPVHPGKGKPLRIFKSVFELLCHAAERAMDEGQTDKARELCRSAFGVLRSRTEANSAARWTNYDDYIDRGVKLSNLLKRVSPPMWDYLERLHAQTKELPEGPLHADELAWLWNDIGLAFYAQGAMADAYAVWELGYEITKVTDSEEGGQYTVQSQLEMMGVFLEMGRLGTAAEYLTQAEKANEKYGDRDYRARLMGYRGLLAHLRNNFDEAETLYAEALELLRRSGKRNLRAMSIFTQHWADLKLAKKELEEARDLIRSSTSMANEGGHVDLVAYARNSHAHLLRAQRQYVEAQAEYRSILEEARRIGLRRLEADVLSEMARLALELGDWNTARTRAINALMVANGLGLGLRRTHGLVVLGLAMIQARNPKLGAAYLRHAWSLARTQGYQLRADEAARRLREIGEELPA
ncbi:MAG TPA: SIR2 family protein [Thermoanaerobaculia bacterium]